MILDSYIHVEVTVGDISYIQCGKV